MFIAESGFSGDQMTIKEMREMPSEELRSEIEKTREKIFKMRFKGKGKDLENPGLYQAMRKDIARLNTLLVERVKKIRVEKSGGKS